ncbi:MAG: lipoate--protein ligase family protein [Verrucomicrobiota bacterium]
MFKICELLDTGERGSAAFNMAVDEVLLGRCEVPLLRVYGWERPAVSFGYFQGLEELPVEDRGGGVDLVRRWTGGGVVRHGEDWTYSLVVPRLYLKAMGGPVEAYAAVHRAIGDLLGESGIEARVIEGEAGDGGMDCFASPVRSDVMVGGEKVAGAAQRRTRAGMLHQGSIQGVAVPAEFGEGLAGKLGGEVRVVAGLPEGVREQAVDLAEEKYGARAWLGGGR